MSPLCLQSITLLSFVLSLHVVNPYRLSLDVVNFNDAISYCEETYNSTIATIFTLTQIEIASSLCVSNSMSGCWIRLNNASQNISANVEWHSIQHNQAQLLDDQCVEIIAKSQTKWFYTGCNHYNLRHPICDDPKANKLSDDEHYTSQNRKLLQNYTSHNISCTSVDENNSTCYINYKSANYNMIKQWESETLTCDPAYFNCIITFYYERLSGFQIHCPPTDCKQCVITLNNTLLQMSNIYGHTCHILQIKNTANLNGGIFRSGIYAPANDGSLFINLNVAFRLNGIFSSTDHSGTKNIVVILNGNPDPSKSQNNINGTHVTGELNYTCTEQADCSVTGIICNNKCNVRCSTSASCSAMSVFAAGGTANVDWHCQDDPNTCLSATLRCKDETNPLISYWVWDSMFKWHYDNPDCVDSWEYPPLTCTRSFSDVCIVTKSEEFAKRNVTCDPRYKYCLIQVETTINSESNMIYECPTGLCEGCTVDCTAAYSCTYSTIHGNNCSKVEINIKEIQGLMTVYAPGNGGELTFASFLTGSQYVLYSSTILSVPGTKNMLLNFGECRHCAGNTYDGRHVTDYMNVSCNRYSRCISNKIICPNDAHCNIDCSSSNHYGCSAMNVTAIEGTHDVNWWCNDANNETCAQAVLYCKNDLSNVSPMQYLNGKWTLSNHSNGCVDIPTDSPTISPTVSPSSAPTLPPTSIRTITKNELNSYQWLGIGLGITILLFLIIGLLYYQYYKQEKMSLYIENCLVLLIGIGEYDQNLTLKHKSFAHTLSDLDMVQHDLENMVTLFNENLNYDIHPKELMTGWKNGTYLKQHWTENELKKFLTDKANYLASNITDGKKYNGLFVVISCHGLEGYICTSDYKLYSKSEIHRVFSRDHPESREIPRIFAFDCCSGNAHRGVPESDELDEKSEVSKIVETKDDIGSWVIGHHNPDYNMGIIEAANSGFQSKGNSIIGSYVVYEFFTRTMEILENKYNKKPFLYQTFDKIQRTLHEEGKQLPTINWYGDTKYVRFRKHSSELHKLTSISDEMKTDGNNNIVEELELECSKQKIKDIQSDEILLTLSDDENTKSHDGVKYNILDKVSDEENV
eukprot:5752_1